MNTEIGQLLFIGIQGHSLTNDEKKFIQKNKISGISLFGRNIESAEQVRDLCLEIQSLNSTPMFIAIDQEGGRVARIKKFVTEWPALLKLGTHNKVQDSYLFSFYQGQELRSLGINLNWAPSLDILSNPLNKVIGDRALSTQVEVVCQHTPYLLKGYKEAGILSCAKHFPGHGNTLLDSHEDLPEEKLSLSDLMNREIMPFQVAIKEKVPFIMTAHILFKNIDPLSPATLSKKIITELLINDLGYKGIVVTDDFDMKALTKYYSKTEIPIQALQAGVNMLLYCNDPLTPIAAIESLQKALIDKTITSSLIERNIEKINALKKHYFSQFPVLTKAETLKKIKFADSENLAQILKA